MAGPVVSHQPFSFCCFFWSCSGLSFVSFVESFLQLLLLPTLLTSNSNCGSGWLQEVYGVCCSALELKSSHRQDAMQFSMHPVRGTLYSAALRHAGSQASNDVLPFCMDS